MPLEHAGSDDVTGELARRFWIASLADRARIALRRQFSRRGHGRNAPEHAREMLRFAAFDAKAWPSWLDETLCIEAENERRGVVREDLAWPTTEQRRHVLGWIGRDLALHPRGATVVDRLVLHLLKTGRDRRLVARAMYEAGIGRARPQERAADISRRLCRALKDADTWTRLAFSVNAPSDTHARWALVLGLGSDLADELRAGADAQEQRDAGLSRRLLNAMEDPDQRAMVERLFPGRSREILARPADA